MSPIGLRVWSLFSQTVLHLGTVVGPLEGSCLAGGSGPLTVGPELLLYRLRFLFILCFLLLDVIRPANTLLHE